MKNTVIQCHIPLRKGEPPFCDVARNGFHPEVLAPVFLFRARLAKSIGNRGRIFYGPCQSDESGHLFADLISLDREWSTPKWADFEHVIMRPALGEIFVAANGIIHVCENELTLITGDFAAGLFRDDHGLVVPDLSCEIRKRAKAYTVHSLELILGAPINMDIAMDLCEKHLAILDLFKVDTAIVNSMSQEIAADMRI